MKKEFTTFRRALLFVSVYRQFYQLVGILLLLGLPFLSSGQALLDFETYIQTASEDFNVNSFSKKMDFLNANPIEMPFLDELEVRTETDRFDWKRQEYTVRSRFNGKKEREQQSAIHQSNMQLLESGQKMSLQEVLEERYSNAIKYYFLKEQIDLYEEQKFIINDRLSVYQKMAQLSTEFNLNNYIKAESASNDLDRTLLELRHNQILMEQQIQLEMQSLEPLRLKLNNFISTEAIAQAIQNAPDSCQLNPRFQERIARIDQHIAEYKLEKIENQQILDYVQLSYGWRNNLDLQEQFSIGAGFTIPLKKSNQAQLNEIEFDQLDDTEKLDNFEFYCQQEILFLKQKASLLWEQIQFIQQQYEDSQAQFSAQSYESLGTRNPLVLLDIEENLWFRRASVLDLKEELYELYLDVLILSGLISQVPLVNYLEE